MSAGMASAPMMSLLQVAAWLPGGLPLGDLDTMISRVHTDTRSVLPGDLFVALRGEHFDANTMLAQAKASGAVAALCHPGASGGFALTGLPCIEVGNTLAALGALATRWRAQFDLPLIAVTGSNGKTTVTQMLASILRAARPETSLATQGNFNNEIGLPLTLLRLRASHRVAVVELGMNHPGEIARLAAMARPTVALVNNAQREHLEFMGTVDAVARENGSVITALPPDGVAVFPQDDAFADVWRGLAGQRRQMTFVMDSTGTGPTSRQADVRCTRASWNGTAWQVQATTPDGALQFTLPMAGRHNAGNALAAATCAMAAGIALADIRRGLESFTPVKGRSRTLPLVIGKRQVMLVDDSYNANPDSVQAALDLLAGLPPPRLMVLGDMGEVGDQGELFHTQAGEHAGALGIEMLFTLGELSAATSRKHGAARHFADMPALIAAVLAEMPQVASVLVKGSRFMKMERVVEAITECAQPALEQTHAA